MDRTTAPACSLGTGASDQELLQYIQKAGVHQLAGKIEHWLDKQGSARRSEARAGTAGSAGDCPRDAEGDVGRRPSLPGNIPAALIDKIMASPPLADPEKEEQRQKFLQQIRETARCPCRQCPISISSSSATGRYRLRESLILPGQEYHVTGTCVENPEAQ